MREVAVLPQIDLAVEPGNEPVGCSLDCHKHRLVMILHVSKSFNGGGKMTLWATGQFGVDDSNRE